MNSRFALFRFLLLMILSANVFAQTTNHRPDTIYSKANDSVQIIVEQYIDTLQFDYHHAKATKILISYTIQIRYDHLSGDDLFCSTKLNRIEPVKYFRHYHSNEPYHIFKDGEASVIKYTYYNKQAGKEKLTVSATYYGVRKEIISIEFDVAVSPPRK